jgi:hypothetical protein
MVQSQEEAIVCLQIISVVFILHGVQVRVMSRLLEKMRTSHFSSPCEALRKKRLGGRGKLALILLLLNCETEMLKVLAIPSQFCF